VNNTFRNIFWEGVDPIPVHYLIYKFVLLQYLNKSNIFFPFEKSKVIMYNGNTSLWGLISSSLVRSNDVQGRPSALARKIKVHIKLAIFCALKGSTK